MMKLLKLFTAIGISLLAGFLGSFFTAPAIPLWYAELVKPMLIPPSWLFGPVWTLLYILMGTALFLVWGKGLARRDVKIASGIFGLQLLFNSAWSIIFFGFRNAGWALVEIIFLWLAIAWTLFLFKNISKAAAWLLLPYLLWVSFAIYLNYSIWVLN